MCCIEFISIVVVNGAVDFVGARTGYDVDGAARIASGFRSGLSLRREFNDRVHGQDDASNSRNATLIDGRNVMPEVVVVYAVNLPVNLVRPSAVERAETADVIAAESGLHRDKLREIAAV